MKITYETAKPIQAEVFRDLLVRSTLGERRPIEDLEILKGMLEHADLTCTAWFEGQLIGVARSVTDFTYCCYLSDLAVDQAYQGRGVGKELIRITQLQLGESCKLILLSAPKAVDYYPKLGFEKHPSAWTIASREPLP